MSEKSGKHGIPSTSRGFTSTRPSSSSSHPLGSYVAAVKDSKGPFGKESSDDFSPALVLDDSCIYNVDLSRHIIGRVKELSFIPNLRSILTKEGFMEVQLSYIGGLWVLIELKSTIIQSKFLHYTGVKSCFHELQAATQDFICNERIVWVDIEGIPLNFWSPTTFSRIGTKWGIVMDIKETPSSSFARKRLCIKTSLANNILETFKVDPGYNSDDDSVLGVQNSLDKSQQGFDNPVEESDVEEVSKTVFGDNSHSPSCNEHDVNETANAHSGDQFDIYKLLRKNSNHVDTEVDPSLSHPPGFKSDGPHQVNHQEKFQETSHSENHVDTEVDPSLSYLPGFTPAGTNRVNHQEELQGTSHSEKGSPQNINSKGYRISQESQANDSSSAFSTHVHSRVSLKGGSFLDVLDDIIQVGRSMGYEMLLSFNVQGLGHKTKKERVKELNNKQGVNFLALQETKLEVISHLDVKFLWGNSNFQFVASGSAGNSGGILCVWEESVFIKDDASISDYFIALYGRLPTNSKILIVVI
ncbi:RNA-directed DNA polymerase, eukaryota [Tanacetum coccineum]